MTCLRQSICCFLWFGFCLYVLIESILSTIQYQHDFDEYRYYLSRYKKDHEQDDFDKLLVYYNGYQCYLQFLLLDIGTSGLMLWMVFSVCINYMESRRIRDDYYPLAYTNIE